MAAGHPDPPAATDHRDVTFPVTPRCGACGQPLDPGRARKWCSNSCRQAGYRRRHPILAPAVALPPAQPARHRTVYECPACETRFLGEQRCPDCNYFARRVGLGGTCPHCDEPVAITDLIDDQPNPRRR